jgi:hypothetical protein
VTRLTTVLCRAPACSSRLRRQPWKVPLVSGSGKFASPNYSPLSTSLTKRTVQGMATESDPHNQAIRSALNEVSTEGTKLLSGDSAARERLIASAHELIAATETPVETLLRNIWARVCTSRPHIRRLRTDSVNCSPLAVSLFELQLISRSLRPPSKTMVVPKQTQSWPHQPEPHPHLSSASPECVHRST